MASARAIGLTVIALPLVARGVFATIAELPNVACSAKHDASGGVTSLSCKPGATIPAGSLVVIGWVGTNGSGAVSCGDDLGNNYASLSSASNYGGGVRTAMCIGTNAYAVTTDVNITVCDRWDDNARAFYGRRSSGDRAGE